MYRNAIFIALTLLCSNVSAAFWGGPEQVKVDVLQPGSAVNIDINESAQYSYSFEIGYGFKAGDVDDYHRALKLAGIYGRDPRTGALYNGGISVPLELTITDVGSPGQPTVFFVRADDEDRVALIGGDDGMSYYIKQIAVHRLKPGHYRASLKVLAAVPELSGVPVIFTYSMPGH